MDLADLKTEVATLTGRPDRVNETAAAIRSATLKAHLREYYYRDLDEVSINLGGTGMVWQIDFKGISAYWRSVKYFRKYDAINNVPGDFLTLVPPENLLDQYGCSKQDIYYIAGHYVNINSSTNDQYYLVGFFNLPDVTDANYNSWIAADYPYAIVYDAAATVFKSVGKDEEAAQFKTLLAEQYAMVDASNIQTSGY